MSSEKDCIDLVSKTFMLNAVSSSFPVQGPPKKWRDEAGTPKFIKQFGGGGVQSLTRGDLCEIIAGSDPFGAVSGNLGWTHVNVDIKTLFTKNKKYIKKKS